MWGRMTCRGAGLGQGRGSVKVGLVDWMAGVRNIPICDQAGKGWRMLTVTLNEEQGVKKQQTNKTAQLQGTSGSRWGIRTCELGSAVASSRGLTLTSSPPARKCITREG